MLRRSSGLANRQPPLLLRNGFSPTPLSCCGIVAQERESAKFCGSGLGRCRQSWKVLYTRLITPTVRGSNYPRLGCPSFLGTCRPLLMAYASRFTHIPAAHFI